MNNKEKKVKQSKSKVATDKTVSLGSARATLKRKSEQAEKVSGVSPDRKRMSVSDSQSVEGAGNKMETDQGDVSVAKSLAIIIGKIDAMKDMQTKLDTRIDTLETGLADTMRTLVKEEVGTIKTELNTKIDSIQSELDKVKEDLAKSPHVNRIKLNAVMAGVKETDEENVRQKVEDIFKDGVKEEVAFEAAIRKKSRQQGKDGVIIVTFKSLEEKEKIMANKSKLATSEQYKKVSIFHDVPFEERVMKANMKTLLDTVAKDSLVMKGGRVVKKEKKPLA